MLTYFSLLKTKNIEKRGRKMRGIINRIITIFFCLLMALQIVSIPTIFALEAETSVSSATETKEDMFIIKDGVLIAYKGEDKEVVIPNTVNKIGSGAFKSNARITKVDIPDTVEEIGESAFEDCKQLGYVKMSNKTKTIGINAFRKCKLLNNIELPVGLKEISKGAFEDSGLEVVKMPSTLKTLGEGAFKYSGNLKILELNDGLERIGKEILTTCYKIQGLRIPSSVKKIEGPLTTDMGSDWKWLLVENDDIEIAGMDSYPKLLTEQWAQITYYGGEPSTLKTIYDKNKTPSSKVIFKNKVEFNNITTFEFKEKEIVLRAGEEKKLELNIVPKEAIDNRVHYLSSNKDIVSVNSKGEIKANKSGEALIYAMDLFGHKATLKVIVELSEDEIYKIDENGVLIGYYGHDTIINIPDKVKEISSQAFKEDLKITKVIIGKNVKKIHDDAFSNCKNLSEVDMKHTQSLQLIGDNAFKNCENLEYITIPKSVEKLGSSAFQNCKKLKKVSIDSSSKLNKINENTFNGCVSMQEFEVPQNCTYIGNSAFANTTAMNKFVFSGNKITEIGERAFEKASNLKDLNLPDGLKIVGEKAFVSMKKLEEIRFPASFTGVKNGKDFPALFDIADAENIGNLRSINIDKGNPIYHSYKGSVYKKKSLVYIPMGIEEANIEAGTEVIENYVANAHMGLKKVIAKKGLKKIGKGAFLNCFGLETVILPDSVEEVGEAAFLGCEELKDFKMPENLRHIGKLAFYELENIEQLVIPDKVTELNEYSVAGLDNIKHFILSRNLKKVANTGAVWAPKAEELYLPEKLESVGFQGFSRWSSISHLELPRGLKSVGGEGFALSDSLKSVFIPSNIKFSDDIFKITQGSEDKKLYVFTDKINESIRNLSKKRNIEVISLDYDKITKNNRKIEIQQLENMLSETNHKSKFTLTVKENKPKGTDIFSCNIEGKEDSEEIRLKGNLKAVIELLPTEEKIEYDAYIFKNGKYTKLDTNRVDRFIRVEFKEFGTLILTEKGKKPYAENQTSVSNLASPRTGDSIDMKRIIIIYSILMASLTLVIKKLKLIKNE